MSQIIAICPTCEGDQFKRADDIYGEPLFQCLYCEDIISGDNLEFTLDKETFAYYDGVFQRRN